MPVTLENRQIELLKAIIKHQGLPSGKEGWEKVAELLKDKPEGERARSMYRNMATRFDKALETDNSAAPAAAGSSASPAKKTAARKKDASKPATPKKPRAEEYPRSAESVEDDEDEPTPARKKVRTSKVTKAAVKAEEDGEEGGEDADDAE